MKTYSVNDVASFINDYLNKYSSKSKLHSKKPLFIIYDGNEDSCLDLQQNIYTSYKIDFETGDLGRKFNIEKLFSNETKIVLKYVLITKRLLNIY